MMIITGVIIYELKRITLKLDIRTFCFGCWKICNRMRTTVLPFEILYKNVIRYNGLEIFFTLKCVTHPIHCSLNSAPLFEIPSDFRFIFSLDYFTEDFLKFLGYVILTILFI